MPNVPKTLMYIIHHVFIPMKLPQEDDHDASNDFALCDQTLRCAIEYKELLSPDLQERWTPIVKMLENLTSAHKLRALAADDVSSSIAGMQPGDTLAFFIRAQNAGLLVRKFVDRTAFESFEVSAPNEKVMETKGKLLCSYPGPAIGVRREIVEESSFLKELSSFLAHMDVDILDSAPTTDKAGSAVIETRDTTHPRYITQLLTGILRGIGEPEEVPRIRKRIADDILWDNAKLPWRRSPLWLVIRVALQTSLHRESNSHTEYKSFMLYLMSTILRRSSEKGLPSDLLFCMRAKLIRRLSKLGSSTPQFVVSEVEQSVEWTQTLLQNRWEAVQRRQEASPPWHPEDLDLLADTHLSLPNSRDYLLKVLRGDSVDESLTSFEPTEFPRVQSLDHTSFKLAFERNSFIALADFELAVETGIDDWVARHLNVEAACTTVSKWIDEYASAAKRLYDSNPEDWSVMLLTLFELWVALDRLSVAQCPLLKDYSPEISVDLLEPLLLRKAASTARLVAIVKYLRGRHEHSRFGWSVFATTMSRDSFAVRYFETSREHQDLMRRIEMDAAAEKQAKLRELGEENARYDRLTAEARSLSHQYYDDRWGFSRHSWYCQKCALESQAAQMSIKVHEWPLSHNSFEAQVTVFELACPFVFRTWRDTTYSLLRESCMHQRLSQSDSEAEIELKDYVGLQQYIQSRANVGRITLASTTKSFLNSHYRDPSIPSTANAACLNNGLSWGLFDTISGSLVKAPFADCDTMPRCTLQLPPDGPYTGLQYSVTGTLHTSNQVIANQADCHRDLSLHEYIAFAGLRSGHRIQWSNVLKELLSRCLSFHREEVHILMMQTAWQIGSFSEDGSDAWESHVELQNVQFASALLNQLRDFIHTIQANWAELTSMRTAIALTCRLLASTTDSGIASTAYALLRQARDITLTWIRRLARMAQDSEESETQEVLLRLCEAAATCRSSYDVGESHIRPFLASIDDVAIVVECGIIVHDNTPPHQTGISIDLQRVLARDRRLAHFLEPSLSLLIRRNRAGLDRAIASLWSDYQAGSTWQSLSPPVDRWYTSRTAESANGRSQEVHLDILSGRMLIDGKPLGRLPPAIINHATYRRIFGQKIFHVVPSSMAGFDYATRSSVSGHQVHLTLRDGTHLIIRAELESRLLELIPPERITGDFPKLLVQEYAHWMDVLTGEVEFRPLESLWVSSAKKWTMVFDVDRRPILETAHSIRLIDIHSRSFEMISAQLEQLEYDEYLTPTCTSTGESLAVDLPRFRLSFSIDLNGNLECQNLPGMVVDPNQSTGTMFGLESRLVLRKASVDLGLPPIRSVIIPVGKVRIAGDGNHTNITVDTRSQPCVRFHRYNVDVTLGRLIGNASLGCELYKVYLHAVSSHCLPDSLTGTTGTEEALLALRSARCKSFQSLDDDAAEILDQIASLTPQRTYYPTHLQVMQRVNWRESLPSTTQHDGFWIIADAIKQHAASLRVFQPSGSCSEVDASPSLPVLLDRAARRNAIYYPPELADIVPPDSRDLSYASRDILDNDHDDEGERIACKYSAMIHEWPLQLNTWPHLWDTLASLGQLSGSESANRTMSYSRRWMEEGLDKTWMSLYDLCRTSSNQYGVLFTLAAMAYGRHRLQLKDLIPTLLAFATVPKFRSMHPPPWPSYDLAMGFQPQRQKLLELAVECAVSLERSPAYDIERLYLETEVDYTSRRRSRYNSLRESEGTQVVDLFVAQWPCRTPTSPPTRRFSFIDTDKFTDRVIPLFRSWNSNADLRDHILAVQRVLNQSFHPMPNSPPIYRFDPCAMAPVLFSSLSPVTLRHLLQRDAPTIGPLPNILGFPGISHPLAPLTDLQSLISEFRSSLDRFPRNYGEGLMRSLKALHASSPTPPRKEYSIAEIILHHDTCRAYVQDVFSSISQAFSPSTPVERVMFTADLWPRITRRSVLGLLATTCGICLTTPWKDILSLFAMALLLYQRSHRMVGCALVGKQDEVWKELENVGYFVGDSVLNVDWLLIQIDGDFLARPLQVQVAKEMLIPSSSENTALQLNMGEGKSSVIVPMVAASLADGTKLTRIIVLKPLANQMFQLLVERLSGLTNRQIFYMPFSRSLRVGYHQARHIHGLYEQCLQAKGVLVVQPEHILSFKLMGIDTVLSRRSDDQGIAKQLVESQHWLERHSRDILDESDEILAVKYQLIYTRGPQMPLEHHPDRWTTIQQVLSLVRTHAPQIQLQPQFLSGIEIGDVDRGRFPSVRILKSDAGDALVSRITDAVVSGDLSNCCFAPLSGQLRRMARTFISNLNVPSEESHLLKQYCEDGELWKSLLLLRGLLAHGILVYALKDRRWRVDYGLDHSRSLLAVPYRAKDVPAPRAEFGHPDVAILLTCLSYFYQGLTENELDVCFQLLFKLDNPALEYAAWTRANGSIPACLHQLSGVNLKDVEQRREKLIPHFCHNHAVVDFYLSQVVFPKEAKEFPEKLTTSSWDIAEEKRHGHLTTGFSGTNDNQYLLPTSISQCDPLDQLSTNAKVLSYLLQPENDHYLCPPSRPGERMSAEQLLEVIIAQTPEIRVLLDVGAQILDMRNVEFVTCWLRLRSDVPAAIFFDENDNLAVVTQDGRTESFITSSFNSQLDKCLVYLDDAHTRGTDLKLPRDYRAAVTLGPKVTKDRLTQGCMRLRKLGFGQSVMFIAPPEVDGKIREAAEAALKSTRGSIGSIDVLRWVMLETCADIKHHIPHWAQQGVDYDRRYKAWSNFKFSSSDSSILNLEAAWLQPEASTLDAMYGIADSAYAPSGGSPLSEMALQIPKIRERCELLGVTSFSHARTEEEQEREVAHEIEREQQVQRPPKAAAANHSTHADVRCLVRDGVIRRNSPAFCGAFPLLREAAGSHAERSNDGWSQDLLATRDFMQTIQSSSHYLGDYLRHVQWIISTTQGASKVLVLVSPYEVNELLPEIRQSKEVHLHLYTPRVMQATKPVDDLQLYCSPAVPISWGALDPILRAQVNLCAGQLYLANQGEYLQLCAFLGIYTQEIQVAGEIKVQSDGFIKPEDRRALTDRADSPFTHSPLPYLKELIGLRRKGMTYAPTHLGKVLHARFLSEEDF
ncbi:hypothetical protein JAAARDRAFT_132396 [Jaapia argillacea MUCL 33604]|uniref:ubiquitinyl hydrolase 1 n=1 Tax=Jaapia argillacea MUCL 33604 TaxID=933084 RepID=A0A067PNI1_9AGAM|nr:hypothetical protein JAAARDRAFT_132396 [Jaapia argillacea MUCL 33604]